MTYLMAGQQSELERLQLQARVWEPAGARLLERLGDGTGLRALDVGCGALGWLRLLSRWVGGAGSVVGGDVQPAMLEAAGALVDGEGLGNVELVRDDLFESALPPASFDLVHARFQLAPLGRAEEQLAAYRRLVRPGGLLVLEEPDTSSWRFTPEAPASDRLIAVVERAFLDAGGDFNAGRRLPELLGDGTELSAEVVGLPAGHPYLRVHLQFASSLEARLLQLVTAAELEDLKERAEAEVAKPGRWGTTFLLIQAFRRL